MEPPNSTQSNETTATTPHEITPELVREVANKVYELLRKDLRNERERNPQRISSFVSIRRGW